MPALIALATGAVNEVELISVVAIPAAPAATAALISAVICAATESSDPPHLGVGRCSRAAASANPYCVGTKKLLVVTWLTNQNCQAGVFGKSPASPFAPDDAALGLEPHAVSSAEAAAVALTSPAPDNSVRRVGLSLMFSVSIASSTLGSTFLMGDLQLIP